MDKITGCKEGGITTVHRLYSDILLNLFTEIESDGIIHIAVRNIQSLLIRLKKECKRIFDPYVNKGIYTLKLHMLEHIVEDISKYSSLDYINAGLYEYLKTVVEQHYLATSN